MSEARELLKRALDYLTESPRSGFNKLCSDIEAELAKPEPEPTAYLVKIDRYKDDDCELYYSQRTALIRRLDDLPPIPSNAKHITPLYTSPPQQEPLSDAEVMRLARENEFSLGSIGLFKSFARAIEKAHGIT